MVSAHPMPEKRNERNKRGHASNPVVVCSSPGSGRRPAVLSLQRAHPFRACLPSPAIRSLPALTMNNVHVLFFVATLMLLTSSGQFEALCVRCQSLAPVPLLLLLKLGKQLHYRFRQSNSGISVQQWLE